MPPEPKKPIEEMLEASAKARRAAFDVDPKMPNPMRARLHEEIARTARGDEPKMRRGWYWFAMSWPIGTAAAAILIGALVMWSLRTPRSLTESRQLAATQPGSANEMLQPAAPEFAAKSADGFREEDKAPSEAGAKRAAIARAGDEKSNALKKFAEVAIAPTQDVPAPAAKGAAASAPALLAENRKAESNVTQQFSNSLPRAGVRGTKAKQAINILNTFQIQQEGNQIRVVDADGSTYTGKIEPIARSNALRYSRQETQSYATRSKDAANAKQNAPPTDNEFSFRATGYNSSLKKPVVFEGSFIPSVLQTKEANADQMSARIVGTARISGESPIEVDAVAVAP
jgi:hypothetical protein